MLPASKVKEMTFRRSVIGLPILIIAGLGGAFYTSGARYSQRSAASSKLRSIDCWMS
jgi:hypothetical protein